jgi:hypothetical protein
MPPSLRSAVLALAAALILAACAPAQSRVILRTSRTMVLEHAAPAIGFTAGGELVLAMPPCTLVLLVRYVDRTEETRERCVDPLADAVLTTPWGRTMLGVSDAPDAEGRATLRFAADARVVQLDPLDRRTWRLGESWRIRHPMWVHDFVWTPTEADLAPFVIAIGAGLGVDATTGPALQPPELLVTNLHASNTEILAGGQSTIELAVQNRGQGPAYRVTATVRSSLAQLHGLQFSFGKIDAGATAIRRARVDLAANTEETSAMLVVVFSEANGFAPANYSRRFPVRVVATAPRLAVTCRTASGDTDVDAGEIVRLRCEVRNDGGRLATEVTTSAAIGGQRAASRAIDIAPRTAETVEVPLRIPTGAAIDQQLVIDVTATESAADGQRATTRVAVTLRRPRVCPSGKLTRAAYRTKRAELDRARAAGALTADEFDRYDAELVGCLDE